MVCGECDVYRKTVTWEVWLGFDVSFPYYRKSKLGCEEERNVDNSGEERIWEECDSPGQKYLWK